MAALTGGVLLGVWLTHLAYAQRFVELAPVLRAGLDWERLEALRAGTLTVEPAATPRPRPARALRTGLLLAAGLLLVLLGADQGLARLYHPARGNAPGEVVILTTQWCGYCAELRNYLTHNGIPHRELDVEGSWRGYWAFRATRARGVPVTVIGDQVVYGYARRDGSSPIDDALEGAGYRLRERIGISPADPPPAEDNGA